MFIIVILPMVFLTMVPVLCGKWVLHVVTKHKPLVMNSQCFEPHILHAISLHVIFYTDIVHLYWLFDLVDIALMISVLVLHASHSLLLCVSCKCSHWVFHQHAI